MSRFQEHLVELQPEMFIEVSPALAAECGLEHMGWCHVVSARSAVEGRVMDMGWCHVVSARSAVEGRVMVTERLRPLTVEGRTVHQVWLPYHWGSGGLTRGDSANDLFGITLDPNVFIQESKVGTCDVRPGRRPTGRALRELVASYQQRAGVGEHPSPHIGTSEMSAPREDDTRPAPTASSDRWTRPRTPVTNRRRGRGSSPTRRCASAARRARWPARSGTTFPRTSSTCSAVPTTTATRSTRTVGGMSPSSNSRSASGNRSISAYRAWRPLPRAAVPRMRRNRTSGG